MEITGTDWGWSGVIGEFLCMMCISFLSVSLLLLSFCVSHDSLTCGHAHTDTHTFTLPNTPSVQCRYICTHTHSCTHTCTHAQAHTNAHIHARTHTLTSSLSHTYLPLPLSYSLTHTLTHTDTYTCTHTLIKQFSAYVLVCLNCTSVSLRLYGCARKSPF